MTEDEHGVCDNASSAHRFRRLVRKDREKQEEKQLEKLAQESPDQFLERLNKLEQRRVEERSTLRHKNSTKWAKEKRLISKFNTKVSDLPLHALTHGLVQIRGDIEEQVKLGKQLSTKQATIGSDDDDEDDDNEELSSKVAAVKAKPRSTEIPLILAPSQLEAESNPWLATTGSPILPSSEYAKLVGVQNDDQSSSSSDSDDEKETNGDDPAPAQPASSTQGTSYGVTAASQEHLKMPTTSKPQDANQTLPDANNDQEHHMNIQEAFADDDVIAEFRKEKVRRSALLLSIESWDALRLT